MDATCWFTTGHELCDDLWETNSEGRSIPSTEPGTFVWSPPPVAAGIAVKKLRCSRHKSTQSTDVVVIPHLFLTEWRKQLHKVSDVVLLLPAGHPAWPKEMHEPLMIAILFPYLNHRPWGLRRTPKLMDLTNAVREVWESDPMSKGPILKELWSLQRRLSGMQESLVSKLLYSKQGNLFQDCKA